MKPWRREHIVTSEKLRKTIFTSLLHRTLEIKTVRNLSYSHRTQENNNNKKIEKSISAEENGRKAITDSRPSGEGIEQTSPADLGGRGSLSTYLGSWYVPILA